ncbi:hypothetical protein CDV31_002589 [Fusarium ambrosium]|uniref:Uncharacterized protein n=1 Tax=Fusarium ambrosium TaxID=131363 RepID=A0A428UWQ5_9HYPO|nr:hypothetical protein CDV31_002589 [Fusarium ambrosium]
MAVTLFSFRLVLGRRPRPQQDQQPPPTTTPPPQPLWTRPESAHPLTPSSTAHLELGRRPGPDLEWARREPQATQ